MKTEHKIIIDDARDVSLEDDVQLVVTSPPYPMVEMWDDIYDSMTGGDSSSLLEEGNPQDAFERMHVELDTVWENLYNSLSNGGIVAINVGDATRSVCGEFREYPNGSRVVQGLLNAGFSVLPRIIWRKPTNSPTKFMGSGMTPPNAYVSMEHEHIIIARKGQTRRLEPGSDRRYESAYFWEERNQWFSDVWEDVTGVAQKAMDESSRERTAAYPIEIPLRLINMFSVYGDTVYDPFVGTGTTVEAAMITGRNSVACEIDKSILCDFDPESIVESGRQYVCSRLDSHQEFMKENPSKRNYQAENYNFSVVTKRERHIQFYTPEMITEESNLLYEVTLSRCDRIARQGAN